jgi:hypothetical protein
VAEVLEDEALEQHYRSVEEQFPVQVNRDYESLVVPTGNFEEPIHRWFRLKEAFSFRMLPRIIKDLGLTDQQELRILDPFAGSGTTLVSAAALLRENPSLLKVSAWGIETNPWLHLLSSVKLAFLNSPPMCTPGHLREIATEALTKIAYSAPTLSTFGRAEFLHPSSLAQLGQLRAAVESAKLCEDEACRTITSKLALLLLGGTIEPAMSLRRDGRALRFEAKKKVVPPFETFNNLIKIVEEDLLVGGDTLDIVGGVTKGDARDPASYQPEASDLDLVLFSPPYPNNIDYTEVYKLESWGTGLIADATQFRQQRLATLRSHPSVKFPEKYVVLGNTDFGVPALLEPILSAVPTNRYSHERKRLIRGYADDMFAVIKNASERLRPGGYLICVVGNSSHGDKTHSLTIAADLIIASLAKSAGLQVDKIDVARYPKRRGSRSAFLRESLVYMRKV